MFTLTSKQRRELGKKAAADRKSGSLPAVLYGPGIKNVNLSLDEKEFERVFREAGKSSLVALEVAGLKEKFQVLINDLQRNGVTGKIIHVDLYQPNLSKEIEAEVPLSFSGESAAVKDLAGTLVKNISSVVVKALPQALPREIAVSIDKLKTFDDTILVKDLVVPDGVVIQKNPDDIVALAVPQQKIEEELEKPIEEKVEEVETIEKEKKEEVPEEGAETVEKDKA